ncbi:MAG: PH domain-containing protein [Candidatus Pacebacteria bacterium]|nr:PH domain-containing protein [Candidatus Paceibacterota bacterium]
MTKKLINLHKNNSDKKSKGSFPGQHENEKVVLVVRKHLIILLPYFLHIALMCLLPILFYIFIVPFALPAFLEEPYSRLFVLLSIIYYGFIWIIIFTIWTDYYLDIWIVTNERILDIEQIGFFNRVVSELDLKRIQDITSSVHGLLPTIFGFGNIHIQTAAEERRFDLKLIPHPVTTRRQITKLYKAAREKDRFIFKGDE